MKQKYDQITEEIYNLEEIAKYHGDDSIIRSRLDLPPKLPEFSIWLKNQRSETEIKAVISDVNESPIAQPIHRTINSISNEKLNSKLDQPQPEQSQEIWKQHPIIFIVIIIFSIYIFFRLAKILIGGIVHSERILSYYDGMPGIDYEHFISQQLNSLGWNSKVTSGSRDQGVDVIASKNNVIIAIQCKRYESSVGNKAVQEVYAAKAIANADYAIVVSNSNFTKSAQQLASANNVILLHHDKLRRLDRLI